MEVTNKAGEKDSAGRQEYQEWMESRRRRFEVLGRRQNLERNREGIQKSRELGEPRIRRDGS